MKRIIVDNIETNYMITEQGKVFNTKTQKYLKGCVFNNGYKYALLTINGKKKSFGIHRLVAEYFIPNPQSLPIVNHIDGNKLNNNVENLEWVTQSKNVQHSYEKELTSKATGKRQKQIININDGNWKRYQDTNYYVDKTGRVYNIKTNILLKQTPNNAGYIRYTLRINNKNKSKLAHVLVMETWGKYICHSNEVINHIDGNTANNNLNNLEVVSKSENMKHACYVLHKNVKPVQALDIKGNICYEFPSVTEASKFFNVSNGAISYALKNNSFSCGYYWHFI